MKKLLPAFLFLACLAADAVAQPAYVGMAKPWQLNFQMPGTPVMERLYEMHYFLLILITVISLFVLAVMAFICIRFRRSANPNPSRTTHNTLLEVVWTTIPILILVVIAIPSLRLHYYMQRVVDPELTVKVVGYQWYWHYDYPELGGFGFDSYIKKDSELKPGEPRMLTVDNQLVVPVDTVVRVQITAADVIHSWSVPAFGVKRDAVPGKLNESWFKAEKPGIFYGQCSQLCGVGHGYMPIVVNVVSKDDFAAWVKSKQAESVTTPAATEPAPAATGLQQPAAGSKNPTEKTKALPQGNAKPEEKSSPAPAHKQQSPTTGKTGTPPVATKILPPENGEEDGKGGKGNGDEKPDVDAPDTNAKDE